MAAFRFSRASLSVHLFLANLHISSSHVQLRISPDYSTRILSRRAAPRGRRPALCAPPPNTPEPATAAIPGHVFVVQGDVRMISADAVLYPTRRIDDPKWFPAGPPEGARPVEPEAFTREQRVHPVPGVPSPRWQASPAPEVWLSSVIWEGSDAPPVEWFTSAASAFLEKAYARLEGRQPICGRQLPLLALPVIGTGSSGGKPSSGALLSALLLLLMTFVSTHPVDVVLVTKSRRMFSAAQSVRARLQPLSSLTAASHGASLGPRLLASAERLSELAVSGQLVFFLGSGTSQTNSMPGWSELLTELAELAGFSKIELQQLKRLELKDQAFVLQHRLGTQALCTTDDTCDVAEPSPEAVQEAGRAALQRLAVSRLATDRYSVTHALLATIPHSATVTTNSDLCYDAACDAANIEVVVLPYESRVPGSDAPGRWLLKLHGDVHHPEDIILTYSDAAPYGYEREALSGIVQALLITKHMAFVGFSLTDDAFNQIAATVRRALDPSSSGDEGGGGEGGGAGGGGVGGGDATTFGSALTLSDRPFMAELWPELEALPMGEGLAARGSVDRAMRRRRMEVLLDRVSLLATDTSSHLLDPAFAGAFTDADRALKREMDALLESLKTDAPARTAAAFAEVREMFAALGLPPEQMPECLHTPQDDDAPPEGDAPPAARDAAAPDERRGRVEPTDGLSSPEVAAAQREAAAVEPAPLPTGRRAVVEAEDDDLDI